MKKYGIIKANDEDKIHMNMTTDAAAPMRLARHKKDPELRFDSDTDCVDHQINLLIDESSEEVPEMKESIKRGHAVITHFSRSSRRREEFRNIQKRLGTSQPTDLIQGTKNRWFYKATEIKSLVEKKVAVNVYVDEQEMEEESLSESDWANLEEYTKTVDPFKEAVQLMGGENYPTASRVIPVLEAMRDSLDERDEAIEDLPSGLSITGHRFHRRVRANLEKRFPNLWKDKKPFNGLTLADPTYSNLHFDEREEEEAVKAIIDNFVFDEDRLKDLLERNSVTTSVFSTPGSTAESVSVTGGMASRMKKNRNALIEKKRARAIAAANVHNSVEDRIRAEVKEFTKMEPLDIDKNPLKWYRENEHQFPLLAKYVRNNAHFQATSVSSERVFNKDHLIYESHRSCILPERSETLTIIQDFYTRREDSSKFELCHDCEGSRTRYKIQCQYH